jgi:putative sigma-54 modulation protein
MNIQIKGTKIELTPAIEVAVNEKIGSLSKYFDNILEAEVEVGRTTLHHQRGNIFRAEVNLVVPKTIIRAVAETNDLYASINEVRDKLKQEIIKYKETLRNV